MKKMLNYLFLLLSLNCEAQFTYEHTYTIDMGQETPFLTNLGNNNFKWVLYDWYQDKFSLYNLDHSPFMLNVPLAASSDSGNAYQIGYITNTLFDCDSTTIEYAMMTVHPNDTLKFMVYRTDGTLLFSKDSVTIPYGYGANVGSVEIHGISNTNVGAKLELFKFLNGQFQFFIYGLCGTLPESITEIYQSSSFVQVCPVPSSHQVNFKVISPSNVDVCELIVFNSQFQTLKKFETVNEQEKEINLDCEPLSSGTYFYSLQSKNKIFQTGKFIISK
jgi:hypothetical protein